MLFKDNPNIELPPFLGGFFSGMDRLYIPHNLLILKKIERLDNGDLELTAQAKDGHELREGVLKFKTEDPGKKEILYKWLNKRLGETIDFIYRSHFDFEVREMEIR
ncbi:hypothetical protein KKH23_03270 [Patescibacteria group bacterium]|nr:hypothetical protein [Patescibacteria group bacterium]MBU0777028.1 hypothetical protein [Patescibacteria group bacterium]MBU0846186.1 hypothetical protein [Patescibacteria group bacterium]MBU1066569.1 hypothetical protein [Patescibacteria group bacterium]MBU1844372.1 hypothetical protein [Patescibacteria group bacterium]